MNCPNCRNEIKDGNRYCTKCWTESTEKMNGITINTTAEEERCLKSKEKQIGRFFRFWMTDIEVNKIAYNGIFCLLILGIILIKQPIFKITTAFGEISAATADIEGLSWINIGVAVLNVISFASLLIPNLIPLEWKVKWIMPVTITSILECGVLIYLLVKIEDLLGAILNLFSMEIELTASGWMLIPVFVTTLLCAIKIIWDIRNNYRYS